MGLRSSWCSGVRVWNCRINRSLYGNRWYKHGKGVRWVRALETQRRGVIHYHALLGGFAVKELHRLSWMREWEELAGFARIERPNNARAVSGYCAKYVAKGGEVDIGGPTAAWKRPGEGPPGLWDVDVASSGSPLQLEVNVAGRSTVVDAGRFSFGGSEDEPIALTVSSQGPRASWLERVTLTRVSASR